MNIIFKEGYEIDVIKRFYPEFEAATGIDVNMEVFDEPTARLRFVLDATARTGAYDVTSLSFWNVPEFVKAGWLEPLDAYLDTKLDPWLRPEDMPRGALESMSVGGRLYGLPHTIIGGLTFYRKDVFAELGLQPPQTTADILAAARVIQEQRPDMVPFSGRGAPTFASLGSILGWAYAYGAILFDDQHRPHANSPEMVAAMQDWVTLMRDYGPADASVLTFTAAGERFSTGQAAMMTDTSGFGTIFLNPELSQVVGKVGFAHPTGPAGQTVQWLYNEGLAISSASRNKDAAWCFLQWRMSRETTMKELLELGRTDVPNLFILQSPEYAAYAREHGIEDFVADLQKSWDLATGVHWPYYPEFAQIGDTFAAAISEAIAGGISVQDALDRAQRDLTLIMQEAGHLE
jgi:ABC-type glycerol-3-phosphate transport system substrate-binding protein